MKKKAKIIGKRKTKIAKIVKIKKQLVKFLKEISSEREKHTYNCNWKSQND